MSSPREEIHIDDLASPLLTDVQKAALAWGEKHPVIFSETAVLEAARRRTGLSDFGADDYRARLRVWLAAADEDAGLNALGRHGLFQSCVRYLANRLRFTELWKRHAEIAELEIEKPIIVVGLPRSGTTHLVNLIAADSRLRSLPYWESLEPVPVPGEGPGRDGRDPRWLRCRRSHEMQLA